MENHVKAVAINNKILKGNKIELEVEVTRDIDKKIDRVLKPKLNFKISIGVNHNNFPVDEQTVKLLMPSIIDRFQDVESYDKIPFYEGIANGEVYYLTLNITPLIIYNEKRYDLEISPITFLKC